MLTAKMCQECLDMRLYDNLKRSGALEILLLMELKVQVSVPMTFRMTEYD